MLPLAVGVMGCGPLLGVDDLRRTSGGTSATPGDGAGEWTLRVVNPAEVELPAGYAVRLVFDHSAAHDGSADRVEVRHHATGDTPLALAVDDDSDWGLPSTTIWFRLQQALPAHTSDEGYLLVVSHGEPPPSEPEQVFLLHDDFASGELDSSRWVTKEANEGTVAAAPGEASLVALSNDGCGGTCASLAVLESVAAFAGPLVVEVRTHVEGQAPLTSPCVLYVPVFIGHYEKPASFLGAELYNGLHAIYGEVAEAQDKTENETAASSGSHVYALGWSSSLAVLQRDGLDVVLHEDPIPDVATPLAVGAGSYLGDGCQAGGDLDVRVEWIRARPWARPRPTVSIVTDE